MECDSAQAEAQELLSGVSVVQSSGGITVSVAAYAGGLGDSIDGRSLYPYDGYLAGDLNFPLRIDVAGSQNVGVSFTRSYVAEVHLPAMIQQAMNDCSEAVHAIEEVVLASGPRGCNATTAEFLLGQATRQASATARRDGFVFGYKYQMKSQIPCGLAFTVEVDQLGIVGPGGNFSLRLHQAGTA